MYDLQQRANTVLSFSVSAIFSVFALVSLFSLWCGYGQVESDIRVDVKRLSVVQRRYGPEYYDYRNTKSEFTRLAFDIDVDFTPVFNWNTKQVFVTVVAEYESASHNRNSIVIWDRIISSTDTAKLSLRKVSNKYALIDVSQKWSHQQANLSLHWDITPHVGLLKAGKSATSSNAFVLSPAPKKK